MARSDPAPRAARSVMSGSTLHPWTANRPTPVAAQNHHFIVCFSLIRISLSPTALRDHRHELDRTDPGNSASVSPGPCVGHVRTTRSDRAARLPCLYMSCDDPRTTPGARTRLARCSTVWRPDSVRAVQRRGDPRVSPARLMPSLGFVRRGDGLERTNRRSLNDGLTPLSTTGRATSQPQNGVGVEGHVRVRGGLGRRLGRGADRIVDDLRGPALCLARGTGQRAPGRQLRQRCNQAVAAEPIPQLLT